MSENNEEEITGRTFWDFCTENGFLTFIILLFIIQGLASFGDRILDYKESKNAVVQQNSNTNETEKVQNEMEE